MVGIGQNWPTHRASVREAISSPMCDRGFTSDTGANVSSLPYYSESGDSACIRRTQQLQEKGSPSPSNENKWLRDNPCDKGVTLQSHLHLHIHIHIRQGNEGDGEVTLV